MNYIINPSWFYWLGVVNSMRGFMFMAFIVAIIIIGVSLIIIPVNVKLIQDYPGICDDERKAVRFFTKALKVAIGVCIVAGLFLVFVPSKETLIEMMVAKQATYENATWTVDALKSAVDYVVQAIQSLK
jgi:hypothetical protein